MRRLLVLVVLGSILASCASSDPSVEFETLGPFLDRLIVEKAVPGLGFALFNDEGLLYEHVGGSKSQATGEAVDAATVFEAASISKPLFAHVVYSLVLDGVLELDTPLDTLVPELPELGHDSRAARLTARLLLMHRGGLPNWRSRLNLAAESYSELFAPDDRLEFVLDPGTEYRYSGEGYVLLQRIVEEVTGESLNELTAERLFEPLGMARSSFLLDTEMRRNYSLGHDAEGNPDKWELRVPLASSTLHTTAADLARFGAYLASEIRTGGPFATLADPATSVATDGDRQLSWGLGLGIVTDGARRYLYHGGNNVIFIADFMYGVEENLGYALLTNSSNGEQVVEAVERRVFGSHVRR